MVLHGHHHGPRYSIRYIGGPRHKEKIPSRHSWSRHRILALEIEAAERSRNKISYSTCGPMSSIRNALLSNAERILSRGFIGLSRHPQSPAGASIVRVTLPCQCYRMGLEAHGWSCAQLFEQSLNEVA